MEHPDFVMSMYATKEDLYRAKAEYYERWTDYLENKIMAAQKSYPPATDYILDEAITGEHFNA